jgi:hypothetical protein
MRCQNRHAPIGGCLVQYNPDNERQEETTQSDEPAYFNPEKNGNFVALKR